MIKYLKKFLNYVLTPFRIALFIIVVFIGFRIGGNLNDREYFRHLLIVFNKVLLLLLSVDVKIDEDDLHKYMLHLYSDRKFLVVFNHTSTVDGFAIMKTFPACSFIMSKLQLTSSINVYNLIGYTQKYHDTIGSIFVEKGTTTEKIIQHVQKRKKGDSVLFIAPGAGITPKNPYDISEFTGSGAFAGKFPVLPILIKSEDDSLDCHEGESITHHILKMFLLYDYQVKIKVLDMIEPYDDETIEEFKNRTFSIMNDEYKKIKIDK
jgi:1-acyl-sn-glycerol-3-phosphate acyltransferase